MDQRAIPIFPLPNCVLLPGATQCLHVFEPRYREMLADELSNPPGDRQIAVAMLRPGYEPFYCTHHAPIHPTLCVGDIVKSQSLDDGRYNILLLGRGRVTIAREKHDRSYRRGLLQPLETLDDLEPHDRAELSHRVSACTRILPDDLRPIAEDIASREEHLERVVDMLTFYVLSPEAAPAKQMILAEPRVDFRAKMLITLIERQCQGSEAHQVCIPWPPPLSEN